MSRQRSRHAASRPRVHPLLVAGIVLALLLTVLLVVVGAGHRAGPEPTPGPGPVVTGDPHTPSPAPGAPAPGSSPSGSPPSGAAKASPPPSPAWPDDLTWVTVSGVGLPVSAQAGPRLQTGGRARRFAHTPTGAVLAALHLVLRTSPQVGPAVWGPTLREQVVGPDAAAYAEAVSRSYELARRRLRLADGQPLGRIYASIAGLRVDAYSASAASLRLLVEAPDGAGGSVHAATVVQVSWENGDWALIAPPRGDWASVRTPVPANAMDGYTPLPGRGHV